VERKLKVILEGPSIFNDLKDGGPTVSATITVINNAQKWFIFYGWYASKGAFRQFEMDPFLMTFLLNHRFYCSD